jgi:hypothetical protein
MTARERNAGRGGLAVESVGEQAEHFGPYVAQQVAGTDASPEFEVVCELDGHPAGCVTNDEGLARALARALSVAFWRGVQAGDRREARS